MGDHVIECLTFLLRWLHVVAAIAWIGESFYFVALDRGLKPPKDAEANLYGESWSVHGGGFYRKQKYLPAPLQLPAEVHWSKWKSYTTWMSGLALLTTVYLFSPQVYLIDPAVAAWTPTQAVLLALALPLFGWLCYDGLCRLFHDRDDMLGAAIAGLVLLLCYATLATAWLIWRSARRIHAGVTGRWPVAWRQIPFLRRLKYPILFAAAIAAAATDLSFDGLALRDLILVSTVVLLALLRKRAA